MKLLNLGVISAGILIFQDVNFKTQVAEGHH